MPKILIVKGPTYFSQGDEKSFFDWLTSIACVASVGAALRDLHITLKRSPTDLQLRELIALFYRYRMDMKVLAILKTRRNTAWFSKPTMFWHAKVFGKGVRYFKR